MKKTMSLILALVLAAFVFACPKSKDASDEAAAELQSAPANQINADNAETEADAILKDIDNL